MKSDEVPNSSINTCYTGLGSPPIRLKTRRRNAMPPLVIDGLELARRLDRPYGEVMKWAREGAIPSIKLSSGRRVFHFEQVIKALLKDRREEPAPAGAK